MGTIRGAVAAAALSFAAAWPSTDAVRPPTFADDVAPILQRECAGCHRPGRVAPFSLATYADVRPRARRIAQVVTTREMPPWKPSPGYGVFRDARVLADRDIDVITRWVAAGAPAGSLPPSPTPSPAVDDDGWELGTPDMVLEMSEPFDVPPTGGDIYRCFVLRVDLPGDRYLSAIEVRPGNRRVLHHSIVFLDTSGEGRRLDAADPAPGYASFGGPGFMPTGALGGWSPGAHPHAWPVDAGKPLRRGADVVLHNHYRPDGAAERDRSSIGLHFRASRPARLILTVPILRRDLRIPAGEPAHRIRTTFTTPAPLDIVSIFPHMHELGREMKVFATRPDGREVPLIWIRDWDPHWQGEYVYETPIVVASGTQITVEASYDNSSSNRRNPNVPPTVVSWGNDVTDEMALCLVEVAVSSALDARRIAASIVDQPGLRQ